MKRQKRVLKRIIAIIFVVAIIFSSIATSLIYINSAKAINANDPEPDEAISALDAKIRANTFYYCLINTPTIAEETINSYTEEMLKYGIEMVVDTGSDIWSDDGSVIVPFNFGTTYIKDGELKCEQAVLGYSGSSGQQFQSAVSQSKIKYLETEQNLIDMMTNLGFSYTIDNSEVSDRGCFYLEINTNAAPVDGNVYKSDGTASTNNSTNSSYRGRTNEVCFDLDSNKNIVSAHSEGGEKSYVSFNYAYESCFGFGIGCSDETESSVGTIYFYIDEYSWIEPRVSYTGNFGGGSLSDYTNSDNGGILEFVESTSWDTAKSWATQVANGIKNHEYTVSNMLGYIEQCREGDGDPLIYFRSNTSNAYCGISNFFQSVTPKITEPSDGSGAGKKVWTRPMPVDHNNHMTYFVGSTGNELAYTDDDAYVMYYTLLKDIYGMTFNAGSNLPECQNTAPASDNKSVPVKVRSTGQIVYCGGVTKAEDSQKSGVKGTTESNDTWSKDGKVNAIESVGGYTLAHMGSDELLAKLNALDISKVTDEHIVMIDDCAENPDAQGCNGGGNDGTGPGTETPDAEEDECDPSIEANTKDVECQEKGCYKEAGSMGWIICPVIFGLHDFVDNIYDKHIAPLLAVDKGIVYDLSQMDSSSATYKGWALFRNIANILFAIVLLVVVFSQVTGFGIDNYGVKKILPKLIVTAILVNLSFIICGLLVDISNMIGAGIKGLFESVAGNVTIAGTQAESSKMAGIILNGLLILVAGGGIAAGAIAISSGAITGWSIVLPLLLIGLAAFITVICALVVLGARQAIIAILIVISPLAFVCYALPNLNGVFKKWLKLFEAMLMVFPICGALVGGGYFASCIILGANSDGSILMLIISAIVCMVPYFLIPSVTSRAMNAVGGLAGRVMGMGRGVSNGIGNRARNSEAYKNRIKNSQDAARARAANRYLNGRRGRRDLATVEGGGTLNKHRSSRLSNALKMANADYAENKGILDEAQNRRDIASGSMSAVDAFKRDQGHRDLDDKAAHIGALTQAAEMERMDANNNREFADNNNSAAIEAEAIALAGAGLGDAANLSRYNAAMNRLAKIDPSAYRRAIDGSIAAGNHDAATRQAIKDNAIANSDIAKEQGLKGLTKANAANGLDTADSYTQQQAAGSVKDMLNLDDDYVARLAGDTVNGQGPIAANSNIQDTARMALEAMAANPKMAEDKKAKYLNDLVRIATNGTQSNYADYQANQAAVANQDLISVDLATGGQLTVDRREIPNGDAKQIDPTRSRRIASDEMQIVFKDGSQYNTKSKVFTPSHGGPTP